jgi:hypothetical protein
MQREQEKELAAIKERQRNMKQMQMTEEIFLLSMNEVNIKY